jgi:hypothetical protein
VIVLWARPDLLNPLLGDNILLPETFEVRKCLLTFSLALMRWKVEEILKTYKVFIYGNILSY